MCGGLILRVGIVQEREGGFVFTVATYTPPFEDGSHPHHCNKRRWHVSQHKINLKILHVCERGQVN